MGVSTKLHQLARDVCLLAEIPGPSEQQTSVGKSIDFIDSAVIALRFVLIGNGEINRTLEETLKSFITSFILRRTQ